MQIWLVWTDLEEAIDVRRRTTASTAAGTSRAKLKADGLVPRIKGFFLLDMIGDKDLRRHARDAVDALAAGLHRARGEAARLRRYFFQYEIGITDDHVRSSNVGIPAVDVVDAEFGRMGPSFDGMGEFHHANTDTMDKVSQTSLEIVGQDDPADGGTAGQELGQRPFPVRLHHEGKASKGKPLAFSCSCFTVGPRSVAP